jgi:hypothetical protein
VRRDSAQVVERPQRSGGQGRGCKTHAQEIRVTMEPKRIAV